MPIKGPEAETGTVHKHTFGSYTLCFRLYKNICDYVSVGGIALGISVPLVVGYDSYGT